MRLFSVRAALCFVGLWWGIAIAACEPKPVEKQGPAEIQIAKGAQSITAPMQKIEPRPGMLWIEEGSLVAGTPPDKLPRLADQELPGEQVILKGFYIDSLPYPNEDGAIPLTNVGQAEARALCEEQGKRLCTELEWERACKGPNNYVYEYGDRYRADRCGTGAASKMRPSGLLVGCKSDFGVRDLHGAAFEWTDSSWNRGQSSGLVTTKGGNGTNGELWGRCANALPRDPKTVSGDIGFRCCAGTKNEIEVRLEVGTEPRLGAERRVDMELFRHFMRGLNESANRQLVNPALFEPLKMWRWRPAGNDELTFVAGCTTSKLPVCGLVLGRESRAEFLGFAGSGFRLPTLHTGKTSTDIWLLGASERGPFSRRISYSAGRVDIYEAERSGSPTKK